MRQFRDSLPKQARDLLEQVESNTGIYKWDEHNEKLELNPKAGNAEEGSGAAADENPTAGNTVEGSEAVVGAATSAALAPEAVERRMSDGSAYTAKEFQEYFGDDWKAEWDAAETAPADWVDEDVEAGNDETDETAGMLPKGEAASDQAQANTI